MNIQILVFDGFDEIDVFGPYEVYQKAAHTGADIQATLVTIDERTEVTGLHGIVIKVSKQLDWSADMLLIPGGGWVSRGPQGTWAEAQRGIIPEALRRWYQAGKILTADCTGTMLLAASGLLSQRAATTHHQVVHELREAGTQVIDARVVDDGNIITAAGGTSGMDLALWIVERFVSAECAITVERRLAFERRGTVWSQRPH